MRKTLLFIISLLMAALSGCTAREAPAQVAATTLPVYEFTARLCQDTPITTTRLVTEQVSCLHDYSLNVRQVRAAEGADVIVISGAGLEAFLEDVLVNAKTIDASQGIALLAPEENHHHEDEEAPEEPEGHHHEEDPHIWLSPVNAMAMARNICKGLSREYPQYQSVFEGNLAGLLADLEDLQNYGTEQLRNLSCRQIITFHDGFSYLADAFDIAIVDAMEEESGAEASAKELIRIIQEVELHGIPAIFTEKSGSVAAAGIISRETGAKHGVLDMAMAGDSYFHAMYHNIDTLKEALQ